jgi:hypothetical protein
MSKGKCDRAKEVMLRSSGAESAADRTAKERPGVGANQASRQHQSGDRQGAGKASRLPWSRADKSEVRENGVEHWNPNPDEHCPQPGTARPDYAKQKAETDQHSQRYKLIVATRIRIADEDADGEGQTGE